MLADVASSELLHASTPAAVGFGAPTGRWHAPTSGDLHAPTGGDLHLGGNNFVSQRPPFPGTANGSLPSDSTSTSSGVLQQAEVPPEIQLARTILHAAQHMPEAYCSCQSSRELIDARLLGGEQPHFQQQPN